MNYSQCYEILGLEPGVSWEELQGGYRRQVQKWHPDRHAQDPEVQTLAAQRMLSINEAFGILAQYYRQFGILPGQRAPDPVVAETPDTAVTESVTPAVAAAAMPAAAVRLSAWDFELPAQPDDVFPVVHRRHDNLSALPWLFLFALFGLGYLILAHYVENGSSIEYNGGSLPLAADAPAQRAAANAPVFTYGDTPGRVYEVQGVPTRTSGNLWYYGDAEVYFEKGVVASWQDSPRHPLRVTKDAKPPAAGTVKPRERP